jgi:hypothetical protein
MQMSPGAQALPQEPQFVASVAVSTHCPLQSVRPFWQGTGPHVLFFPVPWHVVTLSAQHWPRHFIRGLGHGLAAKATPGTEAKVPPTKAAPSIRSALRLDTVPLTIPLARASKECSLVSSVIGYIHSPP